MIEKEGVAIGTIDLFDYEPMHARAGLGIWIVQESNRRQGYAKEALRLIIEYAFFKLQLNQLYCCLLYTSPSPRDRSLPRMPSSA